MTVQGKSVSTQSYDILGIALLVVVVDFFVRGPKSAN